DVCVLPTSRFHGEPPVTDNSNVRAVQPRVGLAYQISDKVVMRGGWGRYYLNPSNNYIQSVGFSTTTPLVTSLDGGRTPIPGLINNPFPSGLLLPPGPSAGLLTNVGQSLTVVNHGLRLPHMDQFSFGFQ